MKTYHTKLHVQMIFLMMNAGGLKHVKDAKNWIKTLIQKVCVCWFTLHNCNWWVKANSTIVHARMFMGVSKEAVWLVVTKKISANEQRQLHYPKMYKVSLVETKRGRL